ncbi:MAG: hypothetical protein JXD23_16665 [Spirochaetales bacterium]|nr:hypothetical protein [Spirochaetales bacterium]
MDYGLCATRVYHRVTTWEKGKVAEDKSSESAWFTLGPAGSVEYVWSFNMITALRYLPGLIRMDGRGVKLEYGHLLFFDIGYLFGS